MAASPSLRRFVFLLTFGLWLLLTAVSWRKPRRTMVSHPRRRAMWWPAWWW
ncbi:MAG: hypothetical protein M5U34_02630 [Chloroflexi bacterium]|nr:hypothetical protein [Chloroflexota bacterium]